MKVKLLSYSQLNPFLLSSVEESPISLESIRDLVAFCARVSNPSNQMNMDTSEKLLKYLIKHKHWSPFELVSLCLEITTTRDIARQILRHRSFSFQEFSQRYANPLEDLQFVTREARLQDTKNRQNSIRVEDKDLQHEWKLMQEDVIKVSRRVYEWALSKGIAKEQARAVLPEGLTESRLYMNGTLRSWIHYCELRSANGTQLEHMEITKACAEAIAMVFPQIKDFTNEH
jgi:thymidylate synthase (FAD)